MTDRAPLLLDEEEIVKETVPVAEEVIHSSSFDQPRRSEEEEDEEEEAGESEEFDTLALGMEGAGEKEEDENEEGEEGEYQREVPTTNEFDEMNEGELESFIAGLVDNTARSSPQFKNVGNEATISERLRDDVSKTVVSSPKETGVPPATDETPLPDASPPPPPPLDKLRRLARQLSLKDMTTKQMATDEWISSKERAFKELRANASHAATPADARANEEAISALYDEMTRAASCVKPNSLYEGFLKKRGVRNPDWRRRYVVLTPEAIEYFQERPNQDNLHVVKKGTISISDVVSINVPAELMGEGVDDVVTESGGEAMMMVEQGSKRLLRLPSFSPISACDFTVETARRVYHFQALNRGEAGRWASEVR